MKRTYFCSNCNATNSVALPCRPATNEPAFFYCGSCGQPSANVCRVCTRTFPVTDRMTGLEGRHTARFCPHCGASSARIHQGVVALDIAQQYRRAVWIVFTVVGTGYLVQNYYCPWIQRRVLAGYSPLPKEMLAALFLLSLYFWLPIYLNPLCALLTGITKPAAELQVLAHGPGMPPADPEAVKALTACALLTRRKLIYFKRRGFRRVRRAINQRSKCAQG